MNTPSDAEPNEPEYRLALSNPADEIYPSSRKPDTTYLVAETNRKAPVPDLLYIEAQTRSASANEGEKAVRAHHEQLFLMARGAELRIREHEVAVRQQELQARQREARDLTRQLALTPRFTETPAPQGNTPWTWPDRIEVTLLVLASVAALVVGLINGTRILQATGEPQFEGWLTPFCLSFGVVLGAFLVKSLGRHLPAGPARWWFTATALGVGGYAFGSWLVEYSTLFGKALVPLEERLATLNLNLGETAAAASPAGGEGFRMILTGLAADAVLSGGMWLVASAIWASHHLNRKVENPGWTTIHRSLDTVVERKQREEKLLGAARGRLTALAAERSTLIEQAIGFHRAACARPKA